MSKAIILLIGLSCLAGIDAIALTGGVTTTCDVGELEKGLGDLCAEAKVSNKCNDYCKKKFGAELITAQCTHERANNKRECICRMKCCVQSCWGDPHCTTCDGTKFGYQGLKKYFVLKPLENLPSFPYFEIRQINRPYFKGPMAVLAFLDLFIRDWGLTINVETPSVAGKTFILKVNDKPATIPYRFSKIEDNRELFASVVYADEKKKNSLIIKTSFGIKIIVATTVHGKMAFSGLAIDVPKHPELKGKLGGILGGWDGNARNDGTGPDGKKHPLDIKFSWKFGDSWIVPGGRTPTAECVQKEAEKQMSDIDGNADKTVRAEAEKACKEVLSRPQLKQCVDETGRKLPLLSNCVMDLLFLETAEDRKEFLQDLIESFEETCRRRNKKKGHRSSSSSSSSSSESGEGPDGKKKEKKPKKAHDGTKKPKTPKQPKPAQPAQPAQPAKAAPAAPAKPAQPVKPVAPKPVATKPVQQAPKKEEAVGLEI
jgi:hypothetical protein